MSSAGKGRVVTCFKGGITCMVVEDGVGAAGPMSSFLKKLLPLEREARASWVQGSFTAYAPDIHRRPEAVTPKASRQPPRELLMGGGGGGTGVPEGKERKL